MHDFSTHSGQKDVSVHESQPMRGIEQAVRRPIAVAMAAVAVLLTGLYAARRLPLEITPETDFPELTVSTAWHDTSPEVIESFVTAAIEAEAASLPDVEELSSVSREGLSQVTLKYNRGTDMEFAALALSEKLHKIRKTLPAGCMPPRIQKYVPKQFQKGRFYAFRLSGPLGLANLRRIALKQIKPALLGVDGVADVRVLGGQDRELLIRLDPAALRAFGLDEARVRQALSTLAFKKAIGAVRNNGQRQTLFVNMPVDSVTAIENTVLTLQQGVPVLLKDVAHVADGFGRIQSMMRINGHPAVTVEIKKESGKNTVAVVDALVLALERLTMRLPQGLDLLVLADQSREIRHELSALSQRATYSIAVIFLVLLAFLSTLRAPIIILSTIFFSVLLAFNGFLMAGMSLNLLTLAGLALGFGMLVDNTIVVVENIIRHRQKGVEIRSAAVQGAQEVLLPVAASTLTTIAAFIPFLYLTGDLRLYYLPFTLAVGFSLLASLAVAFLITPAMTATLYRNGLPVKETRWTHALRTCYGQFLEKTLRHRGVTLFLTLAVVGASLWVFETKVSKGEIWGGWGRSGETLTVSLNMPKGARLERCDEIIRRFEAKAVGQAGVHRVETTVYDENARMVVRFTPGAQKGTMPYLIKEALMGKAAYIAGFGIGIYGFGDPFHSGGMSGQYLTNRLEILGYNYQEVKKIARQLALRLKRHPRVKDVNTDASSAWQGRAQEELVLRLQRDKLAAYHLTPQWLLRRIQSHLTENLGRNHLIIQHERVPYTLKFQAADRFSAEDLAGLTIRLPSGQRLRLSQVAQFEKQRVMGAIHRKNQQYMRTVAWDFRGPHKLAQKLTDRIVETTHLSPGYQIQQRQWRMTEADKKQIGLILALSVLLVFMVTAGLFESLLHPFVILLTVPLALSGVFLIFWLTDTPFNQSAYIGVVLLGGIVVNDSILLLDHINQRRRDGELLFEAVVHGTVDRVRPILMTTLTTIGGLLPLVLMEKGDGDIWYALALATIGGLMASTLLVLTVLPALYVALEKWHWRLHSRR